MQILLRGDDFLSQPGLALRPRPLHRPLELAHALLLQSEAAPTVQEGGCLEDLDDPPLGPLTLQQETRQLPIAARPGGGQTSRFGDWKRDVVGA